MLRLKDHVAFQRVRLVWKFRGFTVKFTVTTTVLSGREWDNTFTEPFNAYAYRQGLELFVP